MKRDLDKVDRVSFKPGVDIVDIKRIKKILSTNKESFYRKIFTENEIAYIEKKNHSPQTVGGLFAAKEAISKVLGTGIGQIGWRDLEIIHSEKGGPLVNYNERLRELMEELGIGNIEISISHEREYALAFAIGY